MSLLWLPEGFSCAFLNLDFNFKMAKLILMEDGMDNAGHSICQAQPLDWSPSYEDTTDVEETIPAMLMTMKHVYLHIQP